MHIDNHNLQIDWPVYSFSEHRSFVRYDFSLIEVEHLVLACEKL
jgi:hypothetical protein